MSADNGIYILITPLRGDEYLKQYRVIHCQNIEDLYWDSEARCGSDEIQPAMLREKFGNIQPIGNISVARNKAFDMAKEIYNEGLPLEYGIREIRYAKPFPHSPS